VFHAVGDKTHATKKRRMVGIRERLTKATTNWFGACSQDFPLSLKDQFDKIPDDQKDQRRIRMM